MEHHAIPLQAGMAAALRLGSVDHYTIVVPDAEASARFHCDILGFEFLRIQKINTGTVAAGEFDMLNYVLQLPMSPGKVLVITEGLTDSSVFCQYMKKFGQGVHHVAYEVPDLRSALDRLHALGYRTTSPDILHDPLTGLRQIFIAREHAGYFIELLERTEQAGGGMFTDHNMSALAHSIADYLDAPMGNGNNDCMIDIACSPGEVLDFLANPLNLPRWTGHRTVRKIAGRIVEVRLHGDVPLHVAVDDGAGTVQFTWEKDGRTLVVTFAIAGIDAGCRVSARIPELPPDRAARTAAVVSAELRALAALMEARPDSVSTGDRAIIDAYHLELYQREGL